MPPLFVLAVIYSLFVSFVGTLSGEIDNSLLSYYHIQIEFIRNNLSLFLMTMLLLTIVFLLFSKSQSKNLLGRCFRFLQRLLAVFIVGSFVSFLLLYVIAFMQLNTLSLFASVTPKILGVETDSERITDRLKRASHPPDIVQGSEEENLLLAIATAQSGKNSFYGSRVVSNIPAFLIIPMKRTGAGVLMVGNTLIVARVNSTGFQDVSPVVSYLLIKDYFPGRDVKFHPQVMLLSRVEYQKNREADFRKKLDVFDEVQLNIDENIEQLTDSIIESQQQLIETQERLAQMRAEKEREYTACVNEGYYEGGVYQRVNSREDCRERVLGRDDAIFEVNQEIEQLSNSLQQDQEKLEAYQFYARYYGSQKTLTHQESGYVSYEFASFEPPETIMIAINAQDDPHSLADYFALLVHEYLHYATFDENGDRLTSAFFVEGLTEYFARNIVRSGLGVDTNLGYPVNVKIIDQMRRRVAESDLAEVYFSNDQSGLEKLLDRVYGESFYKDNLLTLETLHYSSSKDQILELGNEVMGVIGGPHLSEEDLATTYSTFR